MEMKYKVFDKKTKQTHLVGEHKDDTLRISEDNQMVYYNLQTKESSESDGRYILLLHTGKKDIAGEDLCEGDVIVSQVGSQLIELRFGKYQAYCPADGAMMDNVGFYAISNGYPQMPIGNLEEYALKIGNIYTNPEFKQNASGK